MTGYPVKQGIAAILSITLLLSITKTGLKSYRIW